VPQPVSHVPGARRAAGARRRPPTPSGAQVVALCPCTPWPLGAGWVETFVSTQRRRQTCLNLPRFAKKERRQRSATERLGAVSRRYWSLFDTRPPPLQVPRGRTQERTTASHTSLVVGGPLGALSGAQRGRRLPSVARLSSADTAHLAVCDPGPGVLAPLSWGSALAISPLPARRTSSAHRGCKPAREREARPPTPPPSVRRKASPPVPPLSRTGRARRCRRRATCGRATCAPRRARRATPLAAGQRRGS